MGTSGPPRAGGWLDRRAGVLGFVLLLHRSTTRASTSHRAKGPLARVAPALASETGSLPAPTAPGAARSQRGRKSRSDLLPAQDDYARTDDDSGSINWAPRPEPFKYYPGAELVPLPRDFARKAVETALIERAAAPAWAAFRGSSRSELSRAPHDHGVTAEIGHAWKAPIPARSASARSALPELSTWSRGASKGSAGLYHYDVKGHALQA